MNTLKKIEMIKGDEYEDYLHIRFSDSPFGYRPVTIEDVKQWILEDQNELIEALEECSYALFSSDLLKKYGVGLKIQSILDKHK